LLKDVSYLLYFVLISFVETILCGGCHDLFDLI
jgi:hypothetical protein